MERPNFLSLKNGEKAKLPFTNSEYNRRVNNLRTVMNKNNKKAQMFTQQAETVRLVSTEKENIAVTDLTIGQYILGWSDPDARHIGVAVPSEVVER